MDSEEDWFQDFDTDDDGHPSSSIVDDDGDLDSLDSLDSGLDGELPTSIPSSRQTLYTVISKANLESLQREALEQVQSILGCTTTAARSLLTFFSWDAESVLSTIAERGDTEVYKRAGVIPKESVEASVSGGDPQKNSLCTVCFCEMTPEDAVSMSCGHTFCSDCWKQHFSIGINEGLSRRLVCMAPRCGVFCDEDQVKTLLAQDDALLLQKYEQALIDGYVDDNTRARWCPSVPHCGGAIRVNGDPHCEVDCPCGEQFCFACGEGPHSPATCEMVQQWVRRIQDGTETASWLRANTKECPKCTKPVEKNGGCNLVLCRCGQAFCWLCGQGTGRAHDWHNIHGHSCGAYKEEAEKTQNEAQRSLKRYLHYLTRYEAHLDSIKLEEKARRELEDKVNGMIEAETSLANYSWVTEALDQLFLARRVMAYSYVFAFYVFGPGFEQEFSVESAATNKELFEDKQGQLEVEVERLANLMEQDHDTLAGSRLSVINLSSSINNRIGKMYDVIENEIAPQVAGRSMDIAPYRGHHAKRNGSAEAVVFAAVVAAANRASTELEGGKKAEGGTEGSGGGGGDSRPSSSAGMKRQRKR